MGMVLIGQALLQGLTAGGTVLLAQAGIAEQPAAMHGRYAVDAAEVGEAQPEACSHGQAPRRKWPHAGHSTRRVNPSTSNCCKPLLSLQIVTKFGWTQPVLKGW